MEQLLHPVLNFVSGALKLVAKFKIGGKKGAVCLASLVYKVLGFLKLINTYLSALNDCKRYDQNKPICTFQLEQKNIVKHLGKTKQKCILKLTSQKGFVMSNYSLGPWRKKYTHVNTKAVKDLELYATFTV